MVLAAALFLLTASAPSVAQAVDPNPAGSNPVHRVVIAASTGESVPPGLSISDDWFNQNQRYVNAAGGSCGYPMLRPKLSPDGTKIAYESTDSNCMHNGISVVNIDGTGNHFVVPEGSNYDVQWPDWLPDGRGLIFSYDGPGSQGYDIYEANLDGTGLTPLLSAPGDQTAPTYSLDSTELAYGQGDPSVQGDLRDREHQHIFVNGTDLGPGSDPAFSPDGNRIAFIRHDVDSNGDDAAATMNVDGTNLQLGPTGGQLYGPSWSPYGDRYLFTTWPNTANCRGCPGGTSVVSADNPTAAGLHFSGNGGASFRKTSAALAGSTLTDQQLAQDFEPVLDFDSTEHWRPLDVDQFLTERAPLKKGGYSSYFSYNTVTASGATPNLNIQSSDDLKPFAGGYLQLGNYHLWGLTHRSSATSDDYKSPPYTGCAIGALYDCDGGPRTALYYYVTPSADLSGYRYIDYWAFYRYNKTDFFNIDAHEGDWEGVSVAPSAVNDNTFDFVSFSQHGAWVNYLRQNLQCDDQPDAKCGDGPSPRGLRVRAFVASGTHANYAQPCTNGVLPSCFGMSPQFPGGIAPESNHDGLNTWGMAYDTTGASLKPFGWWYGWDGKWGASGSSPWSPGTHGQSPSTATFECYYKDAGCSLPVRSARHRTAAIAAAHKRLNSRCRTWFGASVAAVACAPAQLATAVAHHGLSHPGQIRLTVRNRGVGAASAKRRRRGAATVGLAQLLAAPIAPNQALDVTGSLPANGEILVRGLIGRRIVEARFTGRRLLAGGHATIEWRSGRLVLTNARGDVVRPVAVRAQTLPKPRR